LNTVLLDRREILLRHMVRGARLKDAAEEMTKDISNSYERRRQIYAIYKDWDRRESWIESIVRLNDKSYFAELIAGANEATRRCWIEYATGDNSNAKVGALRTIIDGKIRIGLLLMKAGIVKEAPQQIESTMTIAGTPFDLDPEMRKAILEATEHQRLERDKQNVKP
jgi:hypothetical protein